MSQVGAFQPQGNTVSLTTNATINTSNSVLINSTALGVKYKPVQFRFLNVGTDIIWISAAQTATGIVIPTPGTGGGNANYGTPQLAIPIYPLIVEVLTLQAWINACGGVASDGFFLNNISPTASQTLHMTGGEGL